MARSATISDALLHDLMAAGQADIVVGMVTFNHAATVSRVLDAVLEAFTTTLLRERTVLVAADGGSGDGTMERVRGTAASDAARPFRHPLRTVHRIAGAYSGAPSGKTALRVLLAATELLGARCLVLVDPADTALTAAEVTALSLAAFRDGHDLVTPVLPRAPVDGPLVTQLARPVVRALWGRRIAEPLATPLSCSRALVVDLAKNAPWANLPAELSAPLWIVARALGDARRLAQAPVGERAPIPSRGGLVEVFTEIVTTLVECAQAVPPRAAAEDGSADVPLLGPGPEWIAREARIDAAAEAAAFREARPLLGPVWRQILSPEPLAAVLGLPDAGSLDDGLWVRCVYDFLAARRRSMMSPGQLARALLPLYQGRVASFIASAQGEDVGIAAARLEALAVEFERQKPAWRSALGAATR